MSSLENSMASGIGKLQSKVKSLMSDIASAAKAALGIHSPSKVFAGIGENMALGLGEGWNAEYSAIKAKIESGMNFSGGIATMSIATNGCYGGASYGHSVQNELEPSIEKTGDTIINIYNPTQRDAVTEAREWRKTMQRMAIGC